MTYFLLALSLSANVTLVWYIRKLLSKYWSDVEVRERFTEMLGQYAESLSAIYKLEELYGEEILKKAINETRFVQEACEEYKKILETEISEKEVAGIEGEEDESLEETNKNEKGNSPIRLKEGEKISQDADKYKKVIPDL
jgi:hypothetical protein